ncbi:MAG TPA: potassium channel protein [bacterium]|nr:potassium channel protein [bacterium]
MDLKTAGKIARLMLLMLGVLVAGALGYHLLLGWGWLDAFYMAAITVTTVGFQEVQPLDAGGRLFTIFLIITSVSLFAYALTSLTALMVETEFTAVFARRRMDKKIAALSGHDILCGFGRTGQSVSDHLLQRGHRFVVIEQKPENLLLLRERGALFVEGDATHDDALERAGIRRAKGLVAALGNDAENVYLVLSARQMNPELTIVSWASSDEAERKVLRAGADHTLSPYALGGRRIAQLLLNPHTVEFLDHAMAGSSSIQLEEIRISPGSRAVGSSLKGMGVGRDLGVIIIGVRRTEGNLQFNPPADLPLQADDILIGIGSQEQLEKLRQML